MTWLDKLPWPVLILAAVLLSAMPLGQPHLLEKLRMLMAGTLKRPLDWFDLLMHSAPLLLLFLKAFLALRRR